MALIARQTHFRFVRSLVLCGALTLLAGSSAAFTFTFTTIDVPGAFLTEARGINRQGQIVGFYGSPEGTGAQGFLLDQGGFTTINFPGAVDTLLADITGSGKKILGVYTAVVADRFPLPRGVFAWMWPPLRRLPLTSSFSRGFLLARGVFTPIDVPGARDTVPADIGRHGQIAGWYGDTSFFRHGFLLAAGTFTIFDVPGAAYTMAMGLNGRGQIVGWYGDGTTWHGFLRAPDGTFTTIDVPGAVDTFLNSINERGQIVGSYQIVRGGAHGFLLDQGVFTTIDVPGAANTFAWKINGHRIVGGYMDTNGLTHGFLATP
jgi:uncharacterized membrane protein